MGVLADPIEPGWGGHDGLAHGGSDHRHRDLSVPGICSHLPSQSTRAVAGSQTCLAIVWTSMSTPPSTVRFGVSSQ
jgi:hypothetical protein